MGRLFVVNLEGKIYSCKYCRTHLALCEDIVSKSFHSRHGKAYLFNKVVNTTLGETEDRLMMTGMHTVADIFCVGCGSIVGWKYESAHEKSQKYKEGKSVLERTSVDQRLYFLCCYEPNDCMFLLLNPCKVIGPDGSNYWVAREARIGDSDSDDV